MSQPTLPIPSVSAIDAPFHSDKLTPEASGASAWEASREAAAATQATRLPSIDSDYAAQRVLKLWPSLLLLRVAVLSRLSADERDAVAAAFDSLPRLAFAVRFVHKQVSLEDTHDAAFSDLIADALRLRDHGLASCDILEKLGHVPAGTAAAIRKGRGHEDLAADLHALHQALLPHQPRLTALTALATPDAPTLSDADFPRLSHVGSSLQLRLTQAAAQGPWLQALAGLTALLCDAYDVAIAATQYHIKRAKLSHLRNAFPSSSAALRRPYGSAPTPKPATDPATPTP
jgi:hypothetical protein